MNSVHWYFHLGERTGPCDLPCAEAFTLNFEMSGFPDPQIKYWSMIHSVRCYCE